MDDPWAVPNLVPFKVITPSESPASYSRAASATAVGAVIEVIWGKRLKFNLLDSRLPAVIIRAEAPPLFVPQLLSEFPVTAVSVVSVISVLLQAVTFVFPVPLSAKFTGSVPISVTLFVDVLLEASPGSVPKPDPEITIVCLYAPVPMRAPQAVQSAE